MTKSKGGKKRDYHETWFFFLFVWTLDWSKNSSSRISNPKFSAENCLWYAFIFVFFFFHLTKKNSTHFRKFCITKLHELEFFDPWSDCGSVNFQFIHIEVLKSDHISSNVYRLDWTNRSILIHGPFLCWCKCRIGLTSP